MKKTKLKKSQKKRLYSIIIGSSFFLIGLLFEFIFKIEIISSILFILSGASAGYTCVIKAFKGISNGNFFDENTLMTIAGCGAIAIGEYPEFAAVMILYQIGELFQSIAVGKSRNAIRELSNLCPNIAHRIDNNEESDISPEDLTIGDIVRIKTGEKIPADCTIIVGSSSIDTSPVTGESVPRDVTIGDKIFSGCINQNGLLEAVVDKLSSESAAGKILQLTEIASDRKTKSEAFITKFAKVYTPAVTLFAALIAFILPLIIHFINGASYIEELKNWGYRALSMLVISCPCALVISVPLGYFCGLGNASKNAIMIKGSTFIDTLANADTAVFDKTGTLTEGKLSISEVISKNVSDDELILLAASAEVYSSHPIAKAICSATDNRINISDVKEISGNGVSALLEDGRNVKVLKPSNSYTSTAVEIFVDDEFYGAILFKDSIKPSAMSSLNELKNNGIKKTVMLTGDTESTANEVGNKLKIDTIYSQCLPDDKYKKIEELCDNGIVLYVGDGINDSPSLARADVGVAMGVLGSNAAIESADVVLMSNDLNKLAYAKKISKRTLNVVRSNIVFSLGVKLIVLVLAVFLPNITGMGMWAAVLSDVGVCILAVSNSMRLLKNHK